MGNQSYNVWLTKVKENLNKDISSLSTTQGFSMCVPEISVYFIESFGSFDRRDYGTGHELNFIVFLYCLKKVGVLTKADV